MDSRLRENDGLFQAHPLAIVDNDEVHANAFTQLFGALHHGVSQQGYFGRKLWTRP